MRAVCNMIWLAALSIAPAGCRPDALVAAQPEGGSDSGGVPTSDTGASATAMGQAPCSTDGDCPSNEVCGFLISLACGAQGKCFAPMEPTCQANAAFCACDGTGLVTVCAHGLPEGYASKPISESEGPFCDAGIVADASFLDSPAAPVADADTESADGGSPADSATQGPGQCNWPANLNDGGPGACSVGRAYVECMYPLGVECEGGTGASSPSGLTQGCLSNDPTRCSGCSSTSGTATCKSQCAPDQYAVSCGGPPMFSPNGGIGFDYQAPPDGCVGIASTPGGNTYSCCPCE